MYGNVAASFSLSPFQASTLLPPVNPPPVTPPPVTPLPQCFTPLHVPPRFHLLRNKFFDASFGRVQPISGGIEAWTGYSVSFRPIEGRVALNLGEWKDRESLSAVGLLPLGWCMLVYCVKRSACIGHQFSALSFFLVCPIFLPCLPSLPRHCGGHMLPCARRPCLPHLSSRSALPFHLILPHLSSWSALPSQTLWRAPWCNPSQ